MSTKYLQVCAVPPFRQEKSERVGTEDGTNTKIQYAIASLAGGSGLDSENLFTNRAFQSFLRIADNFPAWMHTDEWQLWVSGEQVLGGRPVTPSPGRFCA
jgi:hypothetical protein